MGTRHLIAVHTEDGYKIAQYGQWDGYPSGQGVSVLEFLTTHDLNQFQDKLNKLHWLTKEEIEVADRDPDWPKKYPWLSRDAGADVLTHVEDHNGEIGLINKIDFAGDSLFCEFAYVVDFQAQTFEIYKGFKKGPVPAGERFSEAPLDHDEYKQVRLSQTYLLSDLPSVEQFLKDLKEQDDDE